jgi:hypothetical protein
MVLTGLVLAGLCCGAGAPPAPETPPQIYSELPAAVDPDARYLVYLHGAIIERAGSRPTHPEFGVYEYRQILEVFADRGLVVISEARPSGTEASAYAVKVVEQVRSLIAAGVPPDHVTVAGFSKGGGIAILASSSLARDDVNFVFMAACGPWLDARPGVAPQGRLLALREVSDDLAGSCEGLFARSVGTGARREITLELGGGHVAFYRPNAEWVDPVVEWARPSTSSAS